MYIFLFFLFGGVLSSHPVTYMKFSLITIYGSNVPSKPLSCLGIYGFNESRSFIYSQLYKITSK